MKNQYYKYEITNSFPACRLIKGDKFIVFVNNHYTGLIIDSNRKDLINCTINTLDIFWVNLGRELVNDPEEIERLNKKRLLLEI